MTTTRALMATLFSLALTAAAASCGNISEKKDGSVDGAAGSGAGGTTGGGGAAGSGVAGTTGAGGSSAGRGGTDGSAGRGGGGGSAAGAGGSSAGRGGTDGSGNGGRGGSTGAAGRGGAGGASAGRGGTGGGNAGAGGSTAGRGGAGGGNAGGGGSSAGRGGTGGACACPAIYQPVCGVDGKTYSNDCEARCVNVAVAYQGMCAEECKTNADCVHYPDGVGTCCGACLPTTSPRPPTIACLVPCMTPITCTCVATKCTEMSAGAASSQ